MSSSTFFRLFYHPLSTENPNLILTDRQCGTTLLPRNSVRTAMLTIIDHSVYIFTKKIYSNHQFLPLPQLPEHTSI